MSTEKAGSPIGVGVLTILTVLLVLALAVFSVLTFASAKADFSLSQINAETVTAYYEADTEAKRRQEAFLAGPETEYVATIPMTDAQSLYLHLRKDLDLDGGCTVLAWRTVPANATGEIELESGFNVWDGALLG